MNNHPYINRVASSGPIDGFTGDVRLSFGRRLFADCFIPLNQTGINHTGTNQSSSKHRSDTGSKVELDMNTRITTQDKALNQSGLYAADTKGHIT